MTDILKKNQAFLESGNPYLHKIVTEENPRIEVNLEDVEEKLNFVVEHGGARCFIHSIYDTSREMEEMFKDVDQETERIVLFGFGCGYALEYITAHFSKVKRVFVVEPSLQIFRAFLEKVDIEAAIRKFKDICIIVNQDVEMAVSQIFELTKENANKNTVFVYHISYRSLFEDYFNQFEKNFISIMRSFMISFHTSFKNMYLTPPHILKNIKRNSVPVQRLMQKLAGMPAIIVSAGPSLEKNMHLLENAKKKALVIAVGSAIKVLDSNGIVPHLRCAYSPGGGEEAIFNNIDTMAVPLIHSDILNHLVLPNYKGPTFSMLLDSSQISPYIYKRCGIEGIIQLQSAVSVAIVTLFLLCMSKCNKVILTGQDLCYTSQRMYAKGSWGEVNINSETQGLIKARDIYGNEVYTSKIFIEMVKGFESISNLYQGTELINATQGGLHIGNFTDRNLDEVLEELPERDDIESIIQQALTETVLDDHTQLERLYAAMSEIENEIEKITEINDERFEKLKKVERYRKRNIGVNKRLLELDSIKTFEQRFLEIPFYSEVLRHELNGVFSSLAMAFQYDGEDQYKKFEMQENMLFGISIELASYINMFKGLIREFKESVS